MFSFISGNAFIDMLLMFQEESCFVKKHRPIGEEASVRARRHIRKIDRPFVDIGNGYAVCLCAYASS